MSRTSASYNRIVKRLESISGMDGYAADQMELIEKIVNAIVKDVRKNHSHASLFNYYGENNRCVCCGEVIPEGRQVCPNCEVKANDALHGSNG